MTNWTEIPDPEHAGGIGSLAPPPTSLAVWMAVRTSMELTQYVLRSQREQSNAYDADIQALSVQMLIFARAYGDKIQTFYNSLDDTCTKIIERVKGEDTKMDSVAEWDDVVDSMRDLTEEVVNTLHADKIKDAVLEHLEQVREVEKLTNSRLMNG